MSRSPTLRSLDELFDADLVADRDRPDLEQVAARYAVAITPAIVSAIRHPADALARQFVPSAGELRTLPQENADPIGDDVHMAVPGIVHRYPDRVLLKLVHSCAVYCRFCFRREMVGPGADHLLKPDELAGALDYVAGHPEIWEVVVTGGDPLVVSPRRLRDVMERLGAIPHVRIVRYHTRLPVVAPELVSDELVRALRHDGVTTWLAIHANHPDEFTPAACDAIARLVDAGIPLVSQSVLLKGINDDAQTLGRLMRRFVELRIKPYYLHHPDLAPGTSHFRQDIAQGQSLMRALRGPISGLCQPTYVLDIPGGAGKVPIGPCYIERSDTGYVVEDHRGDRHDYSDPLPIGN